MTWRCSFHPKLLFSAYFIKKHPLSWNFILFPYNLRQKRDLESESDFKSYLLNIVFCDDAQQGVKRYSSLSKVRSQGLGLSCSNSIVISQQINFSGTSRGLTTNYYTLLKTFHDPCPDSNLRSA